MVSWSQELTKDECLGLIFKLVPYALCCWSELVPHLPRQSSGSAVDGCVGVTEVRKDVQLEIMGLTLVDGSPLIKVHVVCSFNIRAVLGIRLECPKCPLIDLLERHISSCRLCPITGIIIGHCIDGGFRHCEEVHDVTHTFLFPALASRVHIYLVPTCY